MMHILLLIPSNLRVGFDKDLFLQSTLLYRRMISLYIHVCTHDTYIRQFCYSVLYWLTP